MNTQRNGRPQPQGIGSAAVTFTTLGLGLCEFDTIGEYADVAGSGEQAKTNWPHLIHFVVGFSRASPVCKFGELRRDYVSNGLCLMVLEPKSGQDTIDNIIFAKVLIEDN